MDRILYRRPLANRYAVYFAPRYDRITPIIVMYEVYKIIKREKGEETALLFQPNSVRVTLLN